MDTFEKDIAKKQLALMKNINANIAFLGKELKRTNDILEKQGIAIMPEAELTVEEPETESVVRVSDIIAWKNMVFSDYLEASKDDPNVVIDRVNRMEKYFEKEGKIVKVNIQKGE